MILCKYCNVSVLIWNQNLYFLIYQFTPVTTIDTQVDLSIMPGAVMLKAEVKLQAREIVSSIGYRETPWKKMGYCDYFGAVINDWLARSNKDLFLKMVGAHA